MADRWAPVAMCPARRLPRGDDRAPHARPGALATAAREVPAVVRGGLAVGTARGPVSWLLCGSLVWGLVLGGIELLWQPRFADQIGGRSDTAPLGLLMAGAFLAAAVGSALAQRLARVVGGGTIRAGVRPRRERVAIVDRAVGESDSDPRPDLPGCRVARPPVRAQARSRSSNRR